jgi:hypothetical protein
MKKTTDANPPAPGYYLVRYNAPKKYNVIYWNGCFWVRYKGARDGHRHRVKTVSSWWNIDELICDDFRPFSP